MLVNLVRRAFRLSSLQKIHFVSFTMASSSSAEQYRCRRLDGKVAVVTASTAGCVYCILFHGSSSLVRKP